MTLEDVLSYIDTAPREDLLKIRNVATRLAYPKRRGVVGKLEGATIVSDSESTRLAELLWFAVKDNYDFMKKPDLSKWSEPIDKLNRIDGRDWKLIQKVILWSTKDDFWKQNVRSGDALRRHFEKCLVKMKSTGALNPAARPVFHVDQAPVVSTEVVDPNSPGYKRFQEMKRQLAEKKDLNHVQPKQESR